MLLKPSLQTEQSLGNPLAFSRSTMKLQSPNSPRSLKHKDIHEKVKSNSPPPEDSDYQIASPGKAKVSNGVCPGEDQFARYVGGSVWAYLMPGGRLFSLDLREFFRAFHVQAFSTDYQQLISNVFYSKKVEKKQYWDWTGTREYSSFH